MIQPTPYQTSYPIRLSILPLAPAGQIWQIFRFAIRLTTAQAEEDVGDAMTTAWHEGLFRPVSMESFTVSVSKM
jgi:hypothetical protein